MPSTKARDGYVYGRPDCVSCAGLGFMYEPGFTPAQCADCAGTGKQD